MSTFEMLGLAVELVVSEEAIRDGFRQKAALNHPDSGGDEKDFSAMQMAQEILLSPAKRIKEWLLVKGVEVDPRGQIDSGLMDLFQKVAEVGTAAEAAIKASENAQSALAKAMAEVALISQREVVSNLRTIVEAEIAGRTALFPAIEAGEVDPARVMRDLVFLEKWRATLKGIYGRLL